MVTPTFRTRDFVKKINKLYTKRYSAASERKKNIKLDDNYYLIRFYINTRYDFDIFGTVQGHTHEIRYWLSRSTTLSVKLLYLKMYQKILKENHLCLNFQ